MLVITTTPSCRLSSHSYVGAPWATSRPRLHSFCSQTTQHTCAVVVCSSTGGNPVPQNLFSNLNPRTLKHEPGSVWGSALLVSGTTIGAGILALPAVTQEAGFVPAAATLTAVCGFSIATGLLVAEVSLRLMQQRGAGSVSMISMASTTLGPAAAAATSAAYVFLHYALLVAYISKAGEIVADVTELALIPSAAAFTVALGLLCYLSSQQLLDKLNGGLVGLVVVCFLGMLVAASPGVDVGSLIEQGHWSAVPATLPVVALAFVYHNVVPVVVQALEGDVGKVRTAICAGVAIPWLMFVSWEGAILGSLGTLESQQAAAAAAAGGGTPVQQAVAVAPSSSQTQQQQQQQQLAGQLQSSSRAAAPSLQQASAGGADPSSSRRQPQQGLPSSPPQAESSSSMAAAGSSSSSSAVADPLAALQAGNAGVGPLIQGFSFLAIATSFIGFILGLTDFLVDGLKLPSRQAPVPYLLTLLPPFAVAVTNPNIFLSALDTAGTYGVLTLFGILPAAMAWQSRYGSQQQEQGQEQGQQQGPGAQSCQPLLPGGAPVLIAVGGAAGAVIAHEVVGLLHLS